jgi:hypothetical protein
MDSFFDKYGRDRVIMDWLKRYKADYARLYNGILVRRGAYADLNELIILAFETGIEFARATERDARTTEESPKVDYEESNE